LERILSKDEISELLSAVKDGEIETSAEVPPLELEQGVCGVDLLGGRGLARWKIPNLDLIFEAVGRSYGITLTNRLQRPVTVKYTGTDSLGFADFLEDVPLNGAIGILNLDPFKSGSLVLFDDQLSFFLLELVLGGMAQKVVPLKRPLTAIEINLLRFLMDALCPDLKKAFAPVEQLRPELIKIEANPKLVNIVPPEAGILTGTFSVTMEGHSGVMTLVIPHASLEPIRDKLREATLSVELRNREEWPQRLNDGIFNMPVEVAVQIGQVTLKVREVLNFQVGDVLELGHAPNAPLRVLVEGKPKFSGMAGTRNGNKAVQIINRLERSE
jgi:flagellar motor switch protein FliM